eukprot:16738-Heterococcus_DN1.PRE.6
MRGEYSPGTAAARRAVAASSRQQRGGSGASGDRDSSSAQLSESEKKVAAARSSGVSPQWRDIETVKKEKTAQLQRVRNQSSSRATSACYQLITLTTSAANFSNTVRIAA